ncbi:hypothetical protein ERO13_D12G222833v2 [Gossypium hirsutum]|nr:hypothetical protein ERO13_D12G222833v2 [Gossypium hirsutum]KAG4117325.1 hypothetical protein ERO13_D12G222833v2 [Gossypium hirsutum]
MRYIAELERKVQTLQTEATPLSAQLTLVQRDTNGLTAENSELKLRLQAMEQQVHLQDDIWNTHNSRHGYRWSRFNVLGKTLPLQFLHPSLEGIWRTSKMLCFQMGKALH